jgi:hypothetical protein
MASPPAIVSMSSPTQTPRASRRNIAPTAAPIAPTATGAVRRSVSCVPCLRSGRDQVEPLADETAHSVTQSGELLEKTV